MKKLIGILGGMGPEATAFFLTEFVKCRHATCDQEHVPIIALSCPDIPDRSSYLLSGGISPLPKLQEYVSLLESSGAKCIVIACNTAHFWLKDLNFQPSTTVIDMIKCTVNSIIKRKIKNICILATDGTINSKLYQNSLSRYGVRFTVPNKEQQKYVMSSIYQIKSGLNVDVMGFADAVINPLQSEGVDCFLMGCTELPILLRKLKSKTLFISSTREAVLSAISWYDTNK